MLQSGVAAHAEFHSRQKWTTAHFFVAEFDQFLILRQARDANAVKGAGSGLDRRSPVWVDLL